MKELSHRIQNITPETAKYYLSTSLGNRGEKNPKIQQWAQEMRDGKWLLNGECIVFDWDGHLKDGHNRLLAVIEAGVPVRMSVIYNVDPTITLWDEGSSRTFADYLEFANHKKYSKVIAAIVKCAETLKKTGRIWANNSASQKSSKKNCSEWMNVFYEDEQLYARLAQESVRLGHSKNGKLVRASWIGGMAYYLIKSGHYDYGYVMKFFEELCSFKSSNYQPIETIRLRLLAGNNTRTSMKDAAKFALIAMGWNAYAKKQTSLNVRIKEKDGELNIPELILNH